MFEVIQVLQSKMGVFGYILFDPESRDSIVIDPSCSPEKILKSVRENGLNVKAIVNTHGHADHVCGNHYLIKETQAPLFIHKDDAVLLAKFSTKMFSRALGGKGSPVPDFFVKDNDQIEGGTIKIKVIHTPGHTKGCICLYDGNNLFTGDTLFTGGVGRTDLSGGSFEQLEKSVREKLFILSDDTIVWPGHNYGNENFSTIGKEKLTNPYFY
ncbi:MAG: MBL fold metallo-hydrolase [Desulforegulaceae bacterium]|nr:MBL fold metallo-hydrolase [Desulforegulaceae bacterium]